MSEEGREGGGFSVLVQQYTYMLSLLTHNFSITRYRVDNNGNFMERRWHLRYGVGGGAEWVVAWKGIGFGKRV